jgi:hypothetical protein
MTMPVGSTTYQKNGTTMTLDVPPYIESGRTLVPVRAISEGLGADVQWNAAIRIVTISLQELDGPHIVTMTIGQMAYSIDGKFAWMEVAPVIVGGRTFVPLRAVGEALGAQVDWDAATRTVLIQGVNASSTPLNDGRTLKELHDAARTWDANGNGISDSLEPFLLQQGDTSQLVCERTLKRTEVFTRTDDTTPAVVLPALSTIVPVGVHDTLTKVRYGGQLTGYIATDALEKRTRGLPSVSDTEKWVVAPGPSLQKYFSDAIQPQWTGYLKPGQTITVKGDTIVGTNTGSDWFGYGTDINSGIPIPSNAQNGAFGIQFRIITRTLMLASDHLEKTFSGDTNLNDLNLIVAEPILTLYGRPGNADIWWKGQYNIDLTLASDWARDGTNEQGYMLSDAVLRSGQLYELRFLDGTGKKAVITLPDGTVVVTLNTKDLLWPENGGCFPDHKLLAIALGMPPRSSATISDLAFVIPPTTP